MIIIINHNNDTIEIGDKLIQLRKLSIHTIERIINVIIDDMFTDGRENMDLVVLKSIDEDKETVIGEW
jgi:hypothetical protein